MAGVGFPLKRPVGRALIVGGPSARSQPLAAMQALGYACAEADDPYAAIREIVRRPMVYRAVILSLASLHREELALVPGIKRRFPHVEVWLTHTDGRQASLAEAMRLGADGLLSGDGLHRIAMAGNAATTAYAPAPAPSPEAPVPLPRPAPAAAPREESAGRGESAPPAAPDESEAAAARSPGPDDADAIGEPVLTVDELRALLQEQPAPPTVGEG